MDIDYRLAFDMAPVGLALSRNRTIMDCNQRLCDMFGASKAQLIGQSFQVLYPSADEYERTGQRTLVPDAPHEAGIWSFEDLSANRPVRAELTPREREVAAHLMQGMTSKQIGKALTISHRTVEIYRARLMRKYKASTTADLVHKLMAG
jgi:DNA-binding CsgD family transcriptional regulator